jgi:2-polyprenyl-3-methyl-5-hydroxy-6-metoxy-1,4-benzoquinol methylase
MTITAPRPIDPLIAADPDHYRDEVVEVRLGGPVPVTAARTASFTVWSSGGRVHLVHQLPPERIDNDLAGLVAEELFAPGWLTGSDLFERLMTGIVLTSGPDAAAAWELFYRNTLARLAELARDSGPVPSGCGSLAAYAPVYAHALSLVGTGPVLELGSCFGFLALQLAERVPVTASDVTANTVRLLARVAPRLDRHVDTLICDAARVPRPDRSYDTVLAVHLLEHLHPEHGAAVLAEMQRLAVRRVVVAVPFEEEPTAAFGHVRVFGPEELRALGTASGWSWESHEHHGGWLVLDRR